MNHYKGLLSALFTIIFLQCLTVVSYAENPLAGISMACHGDGPCCCCGDKGQFLSPENEFIKLTGLDEMQSELVSGAKIEKVFYDNRLYSPYPKTGPTEFSTSDSEEIAALWDAVQKIEIQDNSGMFLTDWYPFLVFYLDSGSRYSVRFDHKMLYLSQSELYNLKNDEEFWDLLGDLYVKYTDLEDSQEDAK